MALPQQSVGALEIQSGLINLAGCIDLKLNSPLHPNSIGDELGYW